MGWQTGLSSAMGGPYLVTEPERLHVADPAHSLRDVPDPNPVWGAPPGTAVGADYLDDYPAGPDPWVVETDGLVLDVTPDDDHTIGGRGANIPEWPTMPTDAGAPGDVMLAQQSAADHSDPYGGSLAANYALPVFQAADERYLSARFEGMPGVELPALVGGGMRGLNGYAVNNPPLEMYGGQGFRRGWVEQSWVDRKMYDATREYGVRWNQPNVADVATNQPSVPVDNASAAGPLTFDSLARIITRQWQKPTIRREPVAPAESLIDDGSGDVYAGAFGVDWVAG